MFGRTFTGGGNRLKRERWPERVRWNETRLTTDSRNRVPGGTRKENTEGERRPSYHMPRVDTLARSSSLGARELALGALAPADSRRCKERDGQTRTGRSWPRAPALVNEDRSLASLLTQLLSTCVSRCTSRGTLSPLPNQRAPYSL